MATAIEIKNGIKNKLQAKGIEYIRPTQKMLDTWDISLKMYNKFYYDKAEMPFRLGQKIHEWLNLTTD